MNRLVALAAGLAILWMMLSGHTAPLLLALGALSIALVVLVTSRLKAADDEGVPTGVFLRVVAYLPWLFKEIVLSNIAVARIIVDPRLPISPVLLRVPLSQQTDMGRVIHANSITMTPGTITVDLRTGEQTAVVHALTRSGADGLAGSEMDRRCAAIERGLLKNQAGGTA